MVCRLSAPLAAGSRTKRLGQRDEAAVQLSVCVVRHDRNLCCTVIFEHPRRIQVSGADERRIEWGPTVESTAPDAPGADDRPCQHTTLYPLQEIGADT